MLRTPSRMLDPSRPLEASFVDLGGESQWPGYEAAYDDASSSAILGMSSELMVQPDDPEGPLLDALARLHAEQARAQRLENALDVSRALGGLSHSPKPTKAAVCVQSFLRGHRARGVAAAARARNREHAACLLQGHIRLWLAHRAHLDAKARRLQRALRRYMQSTLPSKSISALLRNILRARAAASLVEAEHAAACAALHVERTVALAKKDEAIERLIQLLSEKPWHIGARDDATTPGKVATSSAQVAPPPNPFGQGFHPGVECDRSGMNPIVGMRFHLRGHNYDLCQAEYDKLSAAEQGQYEAIPPPVGGKGQYEAIPPPVGGRMGVADDAPSEVAARAAEKEAHVKAKEARAKEEKAKEKKCIGERLFPLISQVQPARAGKITSMLLEMDKGELFHVLESPEALNAKIMDAVSVLEMHAGGFAEAEAFVQAAKLREAELRIHGLLTEKAELARQLHSQLEANRALAEEATAFRLARDAAEDRASELLAQRLNDEERSAVALPVTHGSAPVASRGWA